MSWAAVGQLIAALTGGGGAAADEPLRIEYRRIQAMTCQGNRRVRIDPDGHVYVDVATRECPPGTDWNGPWPAEPVRRLAAAEMTRLRKKVAGSGFFELPGHVVRAGHDG